MKKDDVLKGAPASDEDLKHAEKGGHGRGLKMSVRHASEDKADKASNKKAVDHG